MRFSESTPRPSRRSGPRLWIARVGEDHPRVCTGHKLLERGAARPFPRPAKFGSPPLVLDPHAPTPLSRTDRALARRAGLVAVDCSWNRVGLRGSLPPGSTSGLVPRRLPLLVAANPHHYGRWTELNTVEALSAALYLLGWREEASALLEGFRGGPAFLTINRERLAAYAAAPDAEGVRGRERGDYSAE